MTLRARKFFGLPVETQRGKAIGKIVDVEIDTVEHAVIAYLVTTHPLVQKILSGTKQIVIAPKQVVRITATKMIVRDMQTGQPIDAYEELQAPRRLRSPRAALDTSTRGTRR